MDTKHLAPLLLLAVRQLENALADATAEAELLSRSIAALGEGGTRLHDAGGHTTQVRALPLIEEAHRAMHAMQYHDRLSQRIAHVRDVLASVHAALTSGAPIDWPTVNAAIRAVYTMEDERQLFDEVIGGRPRRAAAKPAGHDIVDDLLRASNRFDDIELF